VTLPDTFLACCDRAIAPETGTDQAPEWVHLMPLGKMTGRDGRVFKLSDPHDVVASFDANGADLPIDYEHQSDKPSSGPVPAAGWIKELAVRENGLWGRVAWTQTASQMISGKEYRYISPSFFHRKDREVIRLKGAGLVHKPNLHLTALASEESNMNDAPTNLQGFMKKLATLLQMPDATDPEVLFAALAKGLSAKPDPAKYVPIEAVAEIMKDRNAQTANMSEQAAEMKVADALRSGHISPAMKPWATALCSQDPASFDSFIASTGPVFGHLLQPSKLDRPFPTASAPIEQSGMEASVCSQLGLPEGSLNS